MKKSVIIFIALISICSVLVFLEAANSSIVSSKTIILDRIISVPGGINVSYDFDNSNIIGEGTSIIITVVDMNNSVVKKFVDNFQLNRDPPIRRNVFVNLPKETYGLFQVNLVMVDDESSLAKGSIDIERPDENMSGNSVTGNTILDQPANKLIGFFIFVAVIIIAIFFILMKHDKNIEDDPKDRDSILEDIIRHDKGNSKKKDDDDIVVEDKK